MILTARLLFLLSFLGFLAQGQNPLELVPGTRVDVLLELADSFKVRATRERAEAEAFAREHGLPIRMEDSLQTIEIRRIENGLPLYNTVDNLTAAYTLNTDDLWNGGVLGLNIEGQNMVVGEWDGGAVLTNHQEFMPPTGGSRAIQQDGATTVNYHATHVAGTLIAEGQVNAARGMANQATLHAYDWYNDNSEMATAAANGLLVSNHSYGSVSGWHYNSSLSRYEWWGISTDTEDYKFGQYSYDAAAWDGIAYNAPYYLIVKSAGNDRGDSGADPYYVYSGSSWVLSTQPSSFREIDGGTDGFDCITTNGNAKNILTVGAVDDISTGWSQASDVSMSSFSGWGPTDDGRIKPDVVGNGIGLYSTYNTNTSSYASLNGTSMAAPNVTGSLILLQQLHLDSIGAYMRSATLKGLVIHTTNEAGSNPGPDYSHGWGLVDMNGAAQIILDQASNDIVESTLNNGGTYTYSVVSDGITPISATLCWTDPAGTSQSAVLNETTSRLVNDLDMVITNGSATWQPWILDPANPANAATTGNNARDNVEKIEAGVLPAGSYTIVVSHKGTLSGGSQNFSMIISGLSGVPSADFTVSQSSLCPGDTISLTSTSTGGATQFAWSISPATGWSFVNGTNANSQNPQVEFTATSGFYAVTLVASNSFGSGSITTDSVIKVGGYLLPYTNNLETSALRDEIEIINNDGNTAWVYSTNAVNGTSLSFNNFTNNNTGSFDWAVLPPLDLSNLSSAQLEFDYAYSAYSSSYSDTLIVAVSTSCGTTYTPVFYQGGVALQTTSAFTQSTFDPSTNADWCDGGTTACPTVDLAPYVGQSGVRIGFINKSGWGNNMYVDNIQVTGTASATPMSISGSQITHVACNGDLSGGIQITVTGGTSPYNYAWSNGATSASISGIGAGTYGVTITDQLAQQVTGSYQVTEPSTLSASASGNDESISGWADGSATVSVSGGSSPYSYAWSNGGTTAFISNLSPATYTVTATDNNSCSVTASVVIGAGVDSLKISSASVQDLDCYQDGSGSVAVSITGGSAPYNYSWSNGATTSSISGLAAGSYQLTVTDGSGQQATGNYSVSEPVALTVSVNGVDESVTGTQDGSASVSAAGGTPPYTYSWSNAATTASISNLAPGNYLYTVTDANLCTSSGSVTVQQGVAVLNISGATVQDLLCYQDGSGSVAVTVTGGTAPYNYVWSSGATAPSISGLAAGSYQLTVSDGSGQQATGSYTVSEPSALSGLLAVNNQTVVSQNDGSIAALIQGGTPYVVGSAYQYNWSNGGTAAQITNLSPGTYTLTVTDSLGCTLTLIDSVETGADLMNIVGLIHTVSCAGGSDGSLDAQIIGGQAPYTYLWSNGATTQDISGLNAGFYTLSASDAVGQSDVQNFLVAEPLPITLAVSSQDESVQGFADGTANASITGGTPPYTYIWSNGATTAQIANLSQGTYAITLTDANNCSAIDSATIAAGVPVLQWSIQVSDVTCNDGSDGSIAIATTGGAAPIVFAWSNGSSTSTLNNLTAGTYAVTATDALGQSLDSVLVVQQPSALSIALVTADESIQGLADGSVSAGVAGGSAGYAYAWSNGATTAQIANLSPGTYTLTVTDAVGCTATNSATINPGVPVLTANALVNHVSCNGWMDGSIALQVSGGTAPIAIGWSNGDTSATISNLGPGTYNYTITDGIGQVATGSGAIVEPAALTASTVVTDESIQGLQDGSVSVLVAGGTTPYQYLWSNGLTMSTLSNLGPGYYTCTITDQNGCVTMVGDTVFDGIPVLQDFTTYLHPACYGDSSGSISVAASGGVPPYAWNWSTGDTATSLQGLAAGLYYLTLSDQSGQSVVDSVQLVYPFALSITGTAYAESIANYADGAAAVQGGGGVPPYSWLWSTGATVDSISGLAAGTYTVTITDHNNCTAIDTLIVAPGVDTLSISISASNPDCFGGTNGSIDLTTNGGVSPFIYQWSQGSIIQDPFGLAANTYFVTVTDALGQVATGSITLVDPPLLQVQLSTMDESVAGYQDGSASALVQGGTLPYSYLWSTGATSDSIGGLAAGVYTLTVTDSLGCSAVVSDTVSTGVPVLQTSVQGQNILCFGGLNGVASIAVVGGASPYSFQWSNGSTSATITGVSAGTYLYTVTDAVGQTDAGSITLNEPTALSVPASITHETVTGQNDGSISLAPSGGTPPYSVLWSTGSTANPLQNLAPGDYITTITDANGCSATDTLTVLPGAALLAVSDTITHESCANSGNGAIALTVTGGIPPYNYLWSNGATGSAVLNLSAGNYGVTVSDGSGQTWTNSYAVTAPAALILTGSTVNPSGFGLADGSISISIAGGSPGYVFSWSDGSSLSSRVGLMAGTYGLTVTDNQGCSATGSWTLTDPAPPALSHSLSMVDVSCFDGSDGWVTVSAVGGVGPYSIVWANGSTLFSLSGLTAGSYAFTVSDGAGQQSVGSAVVSQPSVLMVQAFESSPGNLYAVVSGGTYPYTYSWSTSPVLTDSAISVPMGAEYEVVVTDANGCMADAFVTSTLSLESWNLNIQVYPNPGRDALWLSSDGQMDQVQVMDARGRTVYRLMDGASESLEINTSTWAMGTYYIQIESRGYTRVVKWVLNR